MEEEGCCDYGLISTNLAEKIALTATESPYRTAAEVVSRTSGQSIRVQGIWNVMQRLGERIDEEERHAVKQMEAGQAEEFVFKQNSF